MYTVEPDNRKYIIVEITLKRIMKAEKQLCR